MTARVIFHALSVLGRFWERSSIERTDQGTETWGDEMPLILILAFLVFWMPLVVWGVRADEKRRRRRAMAPLREAMLRIQTSIGELLVPAMRDLAVATARATDAVRDFMVVMAAGEIEDSARG